MSAVPSHPPPTDRAPARLHVDPTRCDGVAICRHLAPELVALDKWGYPMLASGSVSDELDATQLDAARRAVRACPHRALLLG